RQAERVTRRSNARPPHRTFLVVAVYAHRICLLLAQSRHGLLRCTCLLLTQSGHFDAGTKSITAGLALSSPARNHSPTSNSISHEGEWSCPHNLHQPPSAAPPQQRQTRAWATPHTPRSSTAPTR